MVTRITRLLILFQLGIAAGLFILAVTFWQVSFWAALIFSIGLVFMVRLFITSNNFFMSWLYRSETPESLRLKWHHALRLLLTEFYATMLTSSWTMPFHSFAKRSSTNPTGLPVLLIHGYSCNSGYWHGMSKALMKADITHHAVNLEPVFTDIDHYVPIIYRAIRELCEETGHEKIVIVAHSMGGLVARAYLRDHGHSNIARVITLGTPHKGTGLGNFGPGMNSKQMRWQGNANNGTSSDWLRNLEQSEDQATRSLFVSIYSHHDNIISPQTSAHLPGATNVEFHGVGHVALALHPIVQARVIKEIQDTALQLLPDIMAKAA